MSSTHSPFILGRRRAAECSEWPWAEVVWTPSRLPQPSHWYLTPQGPGRLCQMMYQVSRAPGEPWSESHGSWLWPASWKGMPTLATSHCPGRAHHRGARQEDIQHSVPSASPGLLLLLAEHGPPRKDLSTVVYTLCLHTEIRSGFSRLLHPWKIGTYPRRGSSSKPIWGHLPPSHLL